MRHLRTLIEALRRCRADRRGSYSVMVAVLLPVLCGFVGLGTETGLWYYYQQQGQAVADNAAFAAATYYKSQETSSGLTGTAATTAAAGAQTRALAVLTTKGWTNGATTSSCSNVTETVSGTNYTYSSCTEPSGCSSTAPSTGSSCVAVNNPPSAGSNGPPTFNSKAFEVYVATAPQQLLSQIFGGGGAVIRARSVAVVTQQSITMSSSSTTVNDCVLALNASAVSSLLIDGSSTATLTNCDVAANSSASSSTGNALTITTGGTLAGSAVVNGGATGSVSSPNTITTGVTTNDPYSTPTPSVSCANATTITTDYASSALRTGSTTISNTYDILNGFDDTGGSLTFDPGVYYICPSGASETGIEVGSSGKINGTGVTFVLMDASGDSNGTECATVSIASGATVTLTAPTGTTSPAGYTGMVFANAPTCNPPTPTSGTGNQAVFGSSGITITGAIFLPGFHVKFTGSSASSGCTQIIADSVELSGSTSLTSNCSGDGTDTLSSTVTGASTSTPVYTAGLSQ